MARIFLIENDRDFADCLCRILETEGFEVISAETVDNALESISDLQPSVTIIDLHDGVDIGAEDFKRLTSASPDQPILVTANYNTPEIACKALGAGAHDYILKPFSTREILEKIHSLAGTKIDKPSQVKLERISDSIHFISNIDDILRITLDQLASTLHMTDCLIALRGEPVFTVAASRGYTPDPTSRLIGLSEKILENLRTGCDDPLALSTDIAGEIVANLGVIEHCPFPTLMPLIGRDTDNESNMLMGFVMGHGSLVLDENDLLEMEKFLSQITNELIVLNRDGNLIGTIEKFDQEGEFLIPEIPRDDAINIILDRLSLYLKHEHDLFWIRLVIDEAVNNAIIHGHNETLENPITNLKIRFSAGPERLMLTIEDTGSGFDHRHIPDPTSEENLMSINGRGIFLMRNVMDDVVFNESGNRISLLKKLDGKPLGPEKIGVADTELVW